MALKGSNFIHTVYHTLYTTNTTSGQENIHKLRNDSNGEKKLQLKPHWQKSDLKKVVSRYDSLAAHNAAFFLLLVEESRESSIQDPAEFEITVSRNVFICVLLLS